MDGKKLGIAFLAASLTAETVTKHRDDSPHTHIDFEQCLNHFHAGISVYGIPYNQFPDANTTSKFPTIEVLQQIKIIDPF
jgi:hypothetical protein